MPIRSKKKELWVVKSGSNLICTGGPLLIRAWMQQVAELKKRKRISIVWVTSGAIASAIERTGRRKKKKLSEKQALSAIGQPIVMELYDLALRANGLLGAQILLTYDDLANEKRRQNFKNTVFQLLDWGIIPVLNENDAISTEEIQFGDNDSLSARVAATLRADRLVILTDVEGLYESDPAKNPKARLIESLPSVTQEVLRKASPSSHSGRGRGGMFSKVKAAQFASRNGVTSWIVRGDKNAALLRIAEDAAIGTKISRQRAKR
ncbi:MAG: glutamate 5-kinase [Bdellovibrionota bacterium]